MKKIKKVSLFYDLVVGKLMGIYQKKYNKDFDDWMIETLRGKHEFEDLGKYTVNLKNIKTGVVCCIWIENHPYASVYLYREDFGNVKRGVSLKTTNLFIKHLNDKIDKDIATEDELFRETLKGG